MKRFLSILLVLTMMITAVNGFNSIKAEATGGLGDNEVPFDETFNVYNNFQYVERSGKVAIVGYSNASVEEIAVPQSIKGKVVAYIDDYAFANLKMLEALRIPSNVTMLGKGVFNGCPKLTVVEIANASCSFNYSGYNNVSADTYISCKEESTARGFAYNIKVKFVPNDLPLETDVFYRTHVQSYGWQDWVSDGELSGTSGEAKRLEGIEIKLSDSAPYYGQITYRTHVQSYGWQDWKSNGQMSGTSGEAKRLEAIQIKLSGRLAEKYDVYYRVHAQSFGWLGWAKNGEPAGTSGLAKRLEGIQIVVVYRGIYDSSFEGEVPAFVDGGAAVDVNYRTHVQSYGWQSWKSNGQMSGTSGEAKRLEGIEITLGDSPFSGGIQYRTHVQSYGWQSWKSNGQMSGTSGEGKRLEAIEIKLTDNMALYYDVYYRVHAQSYGWLGWAKNGEPAGTEGYAKRLEGIEIIIVKKGDKAPGSTGGAYIKK